MPSVIYNEETMRVTSIGGTPGVGETSKEVAKSKLPAEENLIGQLFDPVTETFTDLYLEAGKGALNARDAIDANANIPQEVVDFADTLLRMHYLLYLEHGGERKPAFETRYFGGS